MLHLARTVQRPINQLRFIRAKHDPMPAGPTRTSSRAVAKSSPIRQDNQCAQDTAPLCKTLIRLVEQSNTREQHERRPIQPRRQFGNLLSQFPDGRHSGDCRSVQCIEQGEFP